MFRKVSKNEMLNDWNYTKEELEGVVCGYEKENGSVIGVKLESGEYEVWGCGIDKVCGYKEMFRIVMRF